MSLKNRYDFVYLFDVKNGNPNGDPDSGNHPRVDPETGKGLVTDVCLKRKIRNFVTAVNGEKEGFEIYVKERSVLNQQHERAYKNYDLKPESKKLPKKEQDALKVTGWMCSNFFDIRAFGAVMTTEINCGQVRGPIQFTFAQSTDPIFALDNAITRCAVTNDRDLEKERTIGHKFTVPYGLYRAHGFISANLAEKTGFSEEDLDLLWKALQEMFDHDRSAARGEMAARRLIVFKHDSSLGNAPAHKLFERVQVKRKDDGKPPREFSDYEVVVNNANLPSGITVQELL